MTTTVNINEDVSIETVIALIENGDEVVIKKMASFLPKLLRSRNPKR